MHVCHYSKFHVNIAITEVETPSPGFNCGFHAVVSCYLLNYPGVLRVHVVISGLEL